MTSHKMLRVNKIKGENQKSHKSESRVLNIRIKRDFSVLILL